MTPATAEAHQRRPLPPPRARRTGWRRVSGLIVVAITVGRRSDPFPSHRPMRRRDIPLFACALVLVTLSVPAAAGAQEASHSPEPATPCPAHSLAGKANPWVGVTTNDLIF